MGRSCKRPDGTPVEGCAREALAESAYEFRPTALLGVYLGHSKKNSTGEGTTYLRPAFCGELGAHDPHRPLDTGIVRTVWLSADEVRASVGQLRSPQALKCVEDCLASARYPLSVVSPTRAHRAELARRQGATSSRNDCTSRNNAIRFFSSMIE